MVLLKDLSCDAKKNVSERPNLAEIATDSRMSDARKAKLKRMFYDYGPGNGTLLSLPFDQLVEHGIGHCLKWKKSADPRAVIELAERGPFSTLALSIGQAEKYKADISRVPLMVKVDGHLLVGKEVPYERPSNMSSIERAVDAGAYAIGFTFYIGGKETEADMERCAQIIEKAHRNNLPVFMWAYCRGPLPDAMGADSLFWCAQGVSIAESMGVDVVKQKFPVPAKNIEEYRRNLSEGGYLHKGMPEVEQLLELEPEDPKNMSYELTVKRLNFMSKIAPNTLKIISGGPTTHDQEGLLKALKAVMDAGLEGQIVGRNLWGRPIDEALGLANKMADIMARPEYHRKYNKGY